MDKAEARDLLLNELTSYRRRPYQDLAKLVGTNADVQVRGPSGVQYAIEIDVVWDRPGEPGNIRVLGGIDDGRLPGAMFPLCEDFIMSPAGTFIGE
jgi:hypothetical protein